MLMWTDFDGNGEKKNTACSYNRMFLAREDLLLRRVLGLSFARRLILAYRILWNWAPRRNQLKEAEIPKWSEPRGGDWRRALGNTRKCTACVCVCACVLVDENFWMNVLSGAVSFFVIIYFMRLRLDESSALCESKMSRRLEGPLYMSCVYGSNWSVSRVGYLNETSVAILKEVSCEFGTGWFAAPLILVSLMNFGLQRDEGESYKLLSRRFFFQKLGWYERNLTERSALVVI